MSSFIHALMSHKLNTMAENNPIRGAYLTCSNEIRRLVVRASTVYNQSNSFIVVFFRNSVKTVQKII